MGVAAAGGGGGGGGRRSRGAEGGGGATFLSKNGCILGLTSILRWHEYREEEEGGGEERMEGVKWRVLVVWWQKSEGGADPSFSLPLPFSFNSTRFLASFTRRKRHENSSKRVKKLLLNSERSPDLKRGQNWREGVL